MLAASCEQRVQLDLSTSEGSKQISNLVFYAQSTSQWSYQGDVEREMTEQIDWRARQSNRNTRGLLLRRSEMLRSLRHYMWAQNQGHHTINRLEERCVERESSRRSSLKGRERAIVSQTNTRTVSKAMLRKLLRDGAERIRAFPSA